MTSTPKYLNSSFNIGSIVALNTHPFFVKNNKDEFLISGDGLTISPLMVVVEILGENKSLFDENSGQELIKKETVQCKCLWFSSKTFQFEDTWLSSRLLRNIEFSSQSQDFAVPSYGSSVIFKTASIEIGKKKASLNQLGSSNNDKSRTITALLSFTSPAMQVIGSAKSESKEPIIDAKTGEVRRIISKQLVKCKYYNAHSEKFSEVLIPIEAITILSAIDNNILKSLTAFIQNGELLKTKSDSPVFKETIVKPITINYNLGNYYLEVKDYLENTTREVFIENSSDQFRTLENELEHLPRFKNIAKKLSILSVKDNFRKLSFKHFWRIKYRDNYDNVTTRTLYDMEVNFLDDSDESGNPIKVEYIKAKCILRNYEERFFRVDRIQLLEVLPLEVSKTVIR